MESQRFFGTVKTFNRYAGSGMIVMDDGREVRLRYSAIRGDGVRQLHAGMGVTFMLENRRRGLYAICVEKA